ncbi:MAG: histidine kinase, partial [Tsuneonella sp.]
MDEQRRQETIQRYSLAGRETEPSFDRVTQLATSIFDAPIALVTVLALERQLFRGACGLAGEG